MISINKKAILNNLNIKYAFLTFFIVLTVALCFVQSARWAAGSSDTAFLTEIVESISMEGVPNSKLQASTHEAMQYWRMPVDEVCEADLALPVQEAHNQFQYHTYIILYLIAPLTNIVEAEILLPCLTVISFMLLLLVVFKFLVRGGVPAKIAFLFCVLVSVHPAWSISIFGQLYVDRFFIPLAAIFLYLLFSSQRSYWKIVVVGLLCAMVVERAAFMLGVFSVAYAFLGDELEKSDRKKIFSMGVSFIVVALFLMFFVIDGERYVKQSSGVVDYLSKVLTTGFDEKSKIYIYFSLSLALFAFVRLRLLALTALMLMPNLLGGVGGAEKAGWLSHYHSLYFPFLAMLSASGFIIIYGYLKTKSKKISSYFILLFLIATIIFSNPYKFNDFNLNNLEYNYLTRLSGMISDYFKLGNQSELGYISMRTERLRDALPKNSVISTGEQLMPALYKERSIYFYPVALEKADYILLSMVDNKEGETYFKGAVSYKGIKATEKLDMCLTERMRRSGYNLELPTIVNNVAILSRELEKPIYGNELIRSNTFEKDLDDWNVVGNVVRHIPAGVVVNNANYLSQALKVVENQTYKYELQTYCANERAGFRMQLNWYDSNSAIIAADIIFQHCATDLKNYKIQLISPRNSVLAISYIVGSDNKNVVVVSSSLKKKLN